MGDLEISEMRRMLRNTDEEERLGTVLKLGSLDHPDVIPILVEVLESDTSRTVQEACIISLIRIGTEAVAEEVARLLRHSDAFVRNAASEILQIIGEAAERVISGLLGDPDPDVRQLAVRALGRGELSSATLLLREVVLNDIDVNVVGSAAEYLGEKGGSREDVEALKLACQRFSDPFLNFVVEEALVKIGAG
ncbi:MAG TPA: HEAT repeat domain-containing protein [Syntrophomonadaceae bacterium]|nr:HEAT repeat domain-containing protein [Syntrophomonadaceae bacterium]